MAAASKKIVILANSIRNGQRCVAGREFAETLFLLRAGPWVRLIDPGTKEGEVRIENTYCQGGGHAHVRDMIELPVRAHLNDLDHPEDWLLEPDIAWKRLDRLAASDLANFADPPEELWSDETGPRTVAAGYVRRMKNPASIYLLGEIEDCVATWWKEPAEPGGDGLAEKVRRRLTFSYRGTKHECEITDPRFTQRHQIFETAQLGDRTSVPIKGAVHLCLSLTRPWHGKHYKIAATLFETHA